MPLLRAIAARCNRSEPEPPPSIAPAVASAPPPPTLRSKPGVASSQAAGHSSTGSNRTVAATSSRTATNLPARLLALTLRDRQVVAHRVAGHSSKVVAYALGVSPGRLRRASIGDAQTRRAQLLHRIRPRIAEASARPVPTRSTPPMRADGVICLN